MGRRCCRACMLFLAAMGWLACPVAIAAEPATESWLRGSGRDLEMRLHGEVVDVDGSPVEGAEVSGRIKPFGGGRVIEPAVTVQSLRIRWPSCVSRHP